MKSKKGFLLGEHTINIVIAVLAIIVLIGFGVKLYGIFEDKTNLEKAQTHMNNIVGIIKDLEVQGSGEKEYLLLSPKGWILTAWPNDGLVMTNPGTGSRESYPLGSVPSKCSKNGWQTCLCLCEFEGIDPLNGCNKNNICIDTNNYGEVFVGYNSNFNKNSQYVKYISIDNGKNLLISLKDNKLRITSNG